MVPAVPCRRTSTTLNELRRRGYKLSIGSSSKNTKFILKQIGLDGFFDAIADGTDITSSKPDPEVFLKSAAKLGVASDDCAVVEDAKAGIEAAKAGGMTALALLGDAKGYGLEDYHSTVHDQPALSGRLRTTFSFS